MSKQLNEKIVEGVLDHLRKPNGRKLKNDKLFSEIVPYAWEMFGFKGDSNQTKLELLLINITIEIYDIEAQEEKERQKNARLRDCTLLTFGLLKGYYHTEEKDGKKVNVPLRVRYENYLNNSDFIKLDYPGKGTYQEIKEQHKIGKRKKVEEGNKKNGKSQNRPLNLLTHRAGDGMEEVAKKLLALIENGSYEKYMQTPMKDNNAKIQAILPELCYTLEKFSPDTAESELEILESQKSENTPYLSEEPSSFSLTPLANDTVGNIGTKINNECFDEVNDEAGISVNKTKDPDNRPYIFTIFILTLVSIALLLSLTFEKSRKKTREEEAIRAAELAIENGSNRDIATSIQIINKYIELHPGDEDDLIVKVTPKEINIKDLDYTSSEPTVVTTDKNHIIARYGWDEYACHDVVITVQSGIIEDKAEITVLNPNETGDILSGGTD